MLSSSTEAQLNSKLQSLWNSGGSQIAVLTVPSLEGLSIEEASIKIVDAWKLGTAKGDNGLLLLISRDDRTVRIEVGQGLEGNLPDASASQIIRNVITPRFAQGAIDLGVIEGLSAIVQRTDPEFASQFESTSSDRQSMHQDPGEQPEMPWFMRIILLIVICFLIFTRTGRSILLGMLISGMRGGSGGGGGGFGGGGGGFSGGGASGRW